MSSGSMAQFLRRTRKGSKSMTTKVWKKWCTQILSALCYLHSADPPIVHGNLNCNTIFIQINGLIKIGCGLSTSARTHAHVAVAPNTIHHHVKTFREHVKNLHYFAPEYEMSAVVTPAADIYAFGVCALEVSYLCSDVG
jgi:nuclear receptor-binding protein